MKERIRISDDEIRGCATYRDALVLCFRLSCLELAEVAFDIHLPTNTLSRILRLSAEGDDVRHMPGDKLIPFMAACGNMVPLRWWVMQIDRPFPEVAADLPAHEEVIALREKVARLEESVLTRADLMEVLRELQTPVARPRAQKSSLRLSMRMGFLVPSWMRQEAADMEQTLATRA
jgi:hypothetical protein